MHCTWLVTKDFVVNFFLLLQQKQGNNEHLDCLAKITYSISGGVLFRVAHLHLYRLAGVLYRTFC